MAPAAADASRVDVVEAVQVSSGAEIRTDVHGFGASAGPVHVEGGKVVAHEAEEKKKEEGEGMAAAAAAETTTTKAAE